MAVYDVRLNAVPGGNLPPGRAVAPGAGPFPRFAGKPGVLLDAAGAEVRWVIRCDTETGEVERYDVRGGKWQFDRSTGRVLVVTEFRPAPLAYVRKAK